MASNLLIFAAYGYMQNLTTLVQPLLREKNVGQEKIITFLVAAMFSFLSANAPGQYRQSEQFPLILSSIYLFNYKSWYYSSKLLKFVL